MSDSDTKQSFGLTYHLCILQKMIQALPEGPRKHLEAQFDIVIDAMRQRDRNLRLKVQQELEDVRLNILALEFDRNATERERNDLQDKLDALGESEE